MNQQKGIAPVILLLAIGLVAVLATTSVIYFVFRRSPSPSEERTTPRTSSPATIEETPTEEEWAIYQNSRVGYQFKYPRSWHVEEVTETDETTGSRVYSVKIQPSGSNYTFQLRFERNTTEFIPLSNVPQNVETVEQIPKKAIRILGTPVIPLAYLRGGRVIAFVYEQGSGTDRTCGCRFMAKITPQEGFEPARGENNLLDIPNEILQSIQWLE